MLPDDPRHGTNAGYVQGCRCADCSHAAYLYHKGKRRRLETGMRNRIILGETALEIIRTTPRSALGELTGIKPCKLSQYLGSGADTPVLRSTRDNIIRAGTGNHVVTAIGVQRRIRALHRLGWSAPAIAAAAGMHVESVKDIRRPGHTPQFVARKIAASIDSTYREMCMRLPEPSRSTTKTRNWATRNGWLAPLAWNDIDDPNETPTVARYHTARNPDELDPNTVQRFFEGDHTIPTTRAEKEAIAAEWIRRGRAVAELGRVTGWRAERYTPGNAA